MNKATFSYFTILICGFVVLAFAIPAVFKPAPPSMTVSYQVQDTAGSTIVGFADVRIAADVSQARWQAEITKALTEIKKAKGEPLPVGSVVIVSVFPTPWKSEAK